MASCPACGVEVPAERTDCPGCHLATSLFGAVKEAAGRTGDTDPAFLSTVAELIRSVDLEGAPDPAPAPLLRPSPTSRGPAVLDLPRSEPELRPEPVRPLQGIPPLPAPARGEALRQRASDYLRLSRRLGLDLTGLSARVSSAETAGDEHSLDSAVREIFVHVASGLAVEFEEELARRNEIAQLVPTPSADVELDAIRGAIGAGDLVGADRRLTHVQDELARLEDIWATGRILIASCDLLSETLTELGGDPTPALGPLREGRRLLSSGRRETAERLLARGSLALWALLEPRFFDELKRVRDRLLELRSSGAELGPALADLRAVSTELRRRNFVGTIVAYRGLRGFVGPPESVEGAVAPATEAGPERPSPQA
jgi:hypothetical protein